MEPFFGGGPGPARGRCNFLEGPVNTTTSERDVGPTSRSDVGPTSANDVGPTSLADVGPTPRRIGPTSARCRADEQTTSIRRRADVNYRYVADVVLTSARRRRVYWGRRCTSLSSAWALHGGSMTPVNELATSCSHAATRRDVFTASKKSCQTPHIAL